MTATTATALTAADYRAEAAAADASARESFDRCDTDGFLSQWASGLTARLARVRADLVDAGRRADFDALFDLDGNLVAAKLIEGKFGPVWGVLASDDPRARIVKWVNAFPVYRKTMEKKGYREGRVLAGAWADISAPAGARGLSGVTQVSLHTYRTDGGFSRDVEIVDDGSDPASRSWAGQKG
jgi:hypothetical protein